MRTLVYGSLAILLLVGGVIYWKHVYMPERQMILEAQNKQLAEALATQDLKNQKMQLLERAQMRLRAPTKTEVSVKSINDISDMLWKVDRMGMDDGHLAEVYREARSAITKANVSVKLWFEGTSDYLEPMQKQSAIDDVKTAELKVQQALASYRKGPAN
jgi:hypothetical protein